MDGTDKTDRPAKTTPKRGRGRPRTKTPQVYTKGMLRKIDKMAEAQCKDTTIADALGLDVETFRDEFSTRTHKKREQGKIKILQAQYAGAQRAGKGAVSERIWFGKQHLGQKEPKQEVAVSGTLTLNDAGIALGIAHGAAKHE